MRFNVIVKMDPEKILEARGLGPDHRAAVAIASTVRRFCDPYVPMQQGILKNTATVGPSAEGAYILYGMPYAHYQYLWAEHLDQGWMALYGAQRRKASDGSGPDVQSGSDARQRMG